MSHFICFVIVPRELNPRKDNLEEAVRALLAPFDENLEVEEYSRPCPCIGSVARMAARETADRDGESIDALRKSFSAAYPVEAERGRKDDLDPVVQKAWKAHIKKRLDLEAEIYAAHPLRDAADVECKECSGTGAYLTTMNLKSKWDWWSVGGRWNNFIPDNAIAVEKLLDPSMKEKIPFCIVTPDGQWHERGKMGWFASVSDEKDADDWNREVRKLLEANIHGTAVACDLHI